MQISVDKLNLLKVVYLDVDPDNDININCMNALTASVHKIVEQYPSPYTLFVSGGIDSQAMLYTWKQSGIPFKAVHVNYLGFNDHDIAECLQFCNEQNIELTVLEFDLVDFLENNLNYYAVKYQCASPQICTHMAFSELIETGTKIFSGNLPLDSRLSIDNTIYGLQRYATLAGVNLIPFFLMTDLDVARSSVAISKKLAITNSQIGQYEYKCELYRAVGIPIIPQENKQTGFEQIKLHYDQFGERVTPRMKLVHGALPSKRVFDQLFRNKYLIMLKNQYTPTLILREK